MKRILSLLCCAVATGGCVSPLFDHDISFFDFGTPIEVKTPVPLSVKHFTSIGVDIPQMVFRENGVQVRKSEDNRWLTNPSVLVEKSLRFTPAISAKNKDSYSLFGKLLSLELNRDTNEVVFSVKYTLVNEHNRMVVAGDTFVSSHRVDDSSARSFAEGARLCLADFAEHVAGVCRTTQ